MSFRSGRTWIAVVTAALFVLSAVAHHAVAAGMSTESGMAMPATASGMASHDAGPPCPMSSDCNDMSMQAMTCFAHCTTALGVLAESIVVPVTVIARPLGRPSIRPLTSLNGPPEPPPPRQAIVLI